MKRKRGKVEDKKKNKSRRQSREQRERDSYSDGLIRHWRCDCQRQMTRNYHRF